MQIILKAGVCGFVAGVLLALFLKVVEQLTGVKVYTLLLNVDYIPELHRFSFPEIVEVGFHLVISIVLSICLFFFIRRKPLWSGGQIVGLCTAVCVAVGLLLFPTTALSDRTPAVTSLAAWLYWLAGHGLYGLVLGLFFKKTKPVSSFGGAIR